jgi:hypothetical protein
MAHNTYETDLMWSPNETYINSSQNIHYLAWQIGRDNIRGKALWLIEPVRTSPIDLNSLLPINTVVGTLLDDVLRYGHRRSAETQNSINQLVASFEAEVASAIVAVTDGYR